jgi:hypothetical protein
MNTAHARKSACNAINTELDFDQIFNTDLDAGIKIIGIGPKDVIDFFRMTVGKICISSPIMPDGNRVTTADSLRRIPPAIVLNKFTGWLATGRATSWRNISDPRRLFRKHYLVSRMPDISKICRNPTVSKAPRPC